MVNMRTPKRSINKILEKRLRKTFVQLISDLKNPKQIDLFFKDFLTSTEYKTLTKRIAVAYWLKKGRNIANIKNNLKVSAATITSIRTLLKKEGIKIALKKIEADEWAEDWSKKINKFIK
jgi:uncharacterized protein YerC